jgi:ribosome biogenesis GTPase A
MDIQGTVNTSFLEQMSNEELEAYIKEQEDLLILNKLDGK